MRTGAVWSNIVGGWTVDPDRQDGVTASDDPLDQ